MSQPAALGAPLLGVEGVRARLEVLLERYPGGTVVFDADGTLWSHDVGGMVYEFAHDTGAFKESALDRLAAKAASIGARHARGGRSAALVRAIERHVTELVDGERHVAELQVWAYVDFTDAELRELTALALERGGHHGTLHEEVVELAAWARAQGARTRIVSASPRIVVEEAVRLLGFEPTDVVAGEPCWQGERIDVGLAQPLPYGPEKAVAGRRLLSGSPWLATFGDSGFDLDMMREALLAVGVGQKPSLLAGLGEHPAAVRLSLTE